VGFIWELWHANISPWASYYPYQVSIGNHEYDYNDNSFGETKDPSLINTTEGKITHWRKPSWGNWGRDSAGECGVPVIN